MFTITKKVYFNRKGGGANQLQGGGNVFKKSKDRRGHLLESLE